MSSLPEGPIRSVAIIGGGPAGASLATHLARAGLRVALFDRGGRPPLIVGESLVPATIPFLRLLGIEQEVASYSMYKPGATFVFAPGDSLSFTFAEVRNAITDYSYNVPRDRFDASLLDAAVRAGAKLFRTSVRLERDPAADDRVLLNAEAIASTGGFLDGQPDLIVDATGRVRLLSSFLELPYEMGPRRDTALFAHLENVPTVFPGHVHTDRMDRGWCWRIPLPGRTSVGIVAPAEHRLKFGDDPEKQFDRCLAADGTTGVWAPHAKRISPVLKYNNYQLTTLRGVGANWALVGDAFGFIDPVFSSGMLVSFDATLRLSKTIQRGGRRAWLGYQQHVIDHLAAWRRIVAHYYDGRLFTLFKVGQYVRESWPGKAVNWHFEKHVPRVFTGEATLHRYSRWLLEFMCEHALAGNDPELLRVR